jgi:hypothetical protein
LTNGQGRMIAKRSLSLSKTYLVLGLIMGAFGAVLSGLSSFLGNLATSSVVPVNATASSGLDVTAALPLVSVALQVIAALMFSIPVLLLYVYDKNNGVLEYFLSLGMDQGDVYRQYLKAAILLASGLVAYEAAVNLGIGLAEGASLGTQLEVSALVAVLALPIVSFESLIMMSFSSLQKQRVGSNQPLGMAVGVLLVMPAYIIPLAAPSLALTVDLLLAGGITVLALALYVSSSRLIRREKLLP